MSTFERNQDQLTIGDLFSRSFGVYWAESGRLLPFFVGVTVASNLLGFGLTSLYGTSSYSLLLLLAVVNCGVMAVSQAAISHVSFHTVIGLPSTIAEGIAVGFDRFWACLGLAIVASLALMLGFLLLVVPGFILALMLFVSYPALVVGNKGVFESMRVSRELTKGHRWTLCGVLLLLTLSALAVSGALFYVGAKNGLVAIDRNFEPNLSALIVYQLISSAVSGAIMLYGFVFNVVTYERLRAMKARAQ